jgi:hypothetical protein
MYGAIRAPTSNCVVLLAQGESGTPPPPARKAGYGTRRAYIHGTRHTAHGKTPYGSDFRSPACYLKWAVGMSNQLLKPCPTNAECKFLSLGQCHSPRFGWSSSVHCTALHCTAVDWQYTALLSQLEAFMGTINDIEMPCSCMASLLWNKLASFLWENLVNSVFLDKCDEAWWNY